MAENWYRVIVGDGDFYKPAQSTSMLSTSMVNNLSGLDPSIESHRFHFARHLGITRRGARKILECGTEEDVDVLASEERQRCRLAALTQKSVTPIWHDVEDPRLKGTGFNSVAKIFRRWVLRRAILITPQMITAKRQTYAALNAVLCHAKSPLPLLSVLIYRWLYGQRTR